VRFKLKFSVTLLAVSLCTVLFAVDAQAKFKARDDNFSVDRDDNLIENLRDNDKDEGDIISITLPGQSPATFSDTFTVTRSQGATLTVNKGGSMTFDPRDDTEYAGLTNGQTSRIEFFYTVQKRRDPRKTKRARVRITITGVDPLVPVVANDRDGPRYTLLSNQVYQLPVSILDNDTNADFVSQIGVEVDGVNSEPFYLLQGESERVTLDTGAVLDVSSDGSVTFDPTADTTYQALAAGVGEDFDFGYKAQNDEGQSATSARVRLRVIGPELNLPTAVNDTFTTSADQIIRKDASDGLLANDTIAIPNETLTVSRFYIAEGTDLNLGTTYTLSTGAVFEVQADGSLYFDPTNASVYTSLPSGSAPLTQTFSYFVTNSDGQSTDPATVTLSVSPIYVDTPAAASDDVITLQEGDGRTRIITLNNDLGDPTLEIISISGSGSTGTISPGGISEPVVNTLELENGELYYTAWDDFNGQDTFTYTLQDDDGQQDTATITINVAAVNDAPNIVLGLRDSMLQGTSKTWSGRYASDNLPLGLRARIFDRDNTIYDGLGCDPEAEDCASMQSLYFSLRDPVDDSGIVQGAISDAATCGDGSFTYTPPADFSGSISFDFDACDTNACSGFPSECLTSNFTIDVQEIVRPDSEDFAEPDDSDNDLSQQPLEIGLSAVPNVLVITDDSGSMSWDFMTTEAESEGVFRIDGRSTKYYMFWYDSRPPYDNRIRLEVREEAPRLTRNINRNPTGDFSRKGLWRAQNHDHNNVYYNPEITYKPWTGLAKNGQPFRNSDFKSAIINPWEQSGNRDLSGTGSNRATLNNIGRYYKWIDVDDPNNCRDNEMGVIDPRPSPLENDNVSCREGWLVDIKAETGSDEWIAPTDGLVDTIDYTTNGFADGSNNFPKFVNRTDCAAADFCSLEEEQQNFANYFTYARTRESAAKLALGTVLGEAQNIRVGFTGLKSITGKEQIRNINKSPTTGNKKKLLDAVYKVVSRKNTPLREALQGAGQYFKCSSTKNIMNQSGSPGDGEGGCPIKGAPEGTCQSNTTILFTDGYWNGDPPNLARDADGDGIQSLTGTGISKFDGGAFKGHSSAKNTLADVAMWYYESDLHPSLADDIVVKDLDRARAPSDAFINNRMHQHMKTYIISFGQTPGIEEPLDITAAVDWGNPEGDGDQARVDDTQHAAFNGRGRLFSSSNPDKLASDIEKVLKEIQEGEGAASAVSFSSDELQADSVLYQGSYNIKDGSGSFVARRIALNGSVSDENVWEAERLLDAAEFADRAIFTFDENSNTGAYLSPAKLTSIQANALLERPTLASTFTLAQGQELIDKINYFKGERANELAPDDGRPDGELRGRTTVLGDIVASSPVYVDAPNRGFRLGLPYPQGEDSYGQFLDNETLAARAKMLYVGANDGMLHGFDGQNGIEKLAFIPNEVISGRYNNPLRALASTTYQHRYFVNLPPVVDDVFIGRPNPVTEAEDDKSWQTMLIGGYGAGGKGYFALNVTNPENFTEATEEKLVFWEFSEKDDVYPLDRDGNAFVNSDGDLITDYKTPPEPIKDIGYSTSVPVIAISNILADDGEREWVSLFGNGANSTSGIAKLFLLLVDKGRDGVWCNPDSRFGESYELRGGCDIDEYDFIKLTTGNGADAAGAPNGLGSPRAIDADRNGTVDYVYAGDEQGNMYRFDLCRRDLPTTLIERETDPGWYGGGPSECKFGKTIFKQWTATKIFTARSSADKVQPVISKPIVVAHPTGVGYGVIFGTGRYVLKSDITDTSLQAIYGLWDRMGDQEIPKSALVQQSYSNVCDSLEGDPPTKITCVRTLSSNSVDYVPPTDSDQGTLGWYNELAVPNSADPSTIDFPGERAVRNLVIRGGLAFVNSVVPRQGGTCGSLTGGFGLAFCPLTGTLDCKVGDVFDLNNDGEFTALDRFGGRRAAAINFGDATPSDAAFLGERRFTQLSDGTLNITLTNTKSAFRTGRLSWRRLDNAN
jgi:type IV pilus assembly protein PilY1